MDMHFENRDLRPRVGNYEIFGMDSTFVYMRGTTTRGGIYHLYVNESRFWDMFYPTNHVPDLEKLPDECTIHVAIAELLAGTKPALVPAEHIDEVINYI